MVIDDLVASFLREGGQTDSSGLPSTACASNDRRSAFAEPNDERCELADGFG
jgi:hypothetical protein